MDRYQLRKLYAVGLSQREIAKVGISEHCQKVLQGRTHALRKTSRNRRRMIITPKVEEFIRECLNEDEKEVVKQNILQTDLRSAVQVGLFRRESYMLVVA